MPGPMAVYNSSAQLVYINSKFKKILTPDDSENSLELSGYRWARLIQKQNSLLPGRLFGLYREGSLNSHRIEISLHEKKYMFLVTMSDFKFEGFSGAIAQLTNITESHNEEIKALHFQRDFSKELDIAAQVQRHLNNSIIEYIEGRFFKYHIFSRFSPSWYLSGDIMNISQINRRYFSIFLGDGRGHGLSSALYSGLMYSYINLLGNEVTAGTDSTAELLHKLNETACHDLKKSPESHFFSGIFALVDGNTRQFRITNAGHPFPVLVRGQKMIRFKTHGPVLGVLNTAQYTQEEIELEDGDLFIFFSDGLYEIFDTSGNLLGEENIMRFIQGYLVNGGDPRELHHEIMNYVDRHNTEEKKDDDISLMVMLVEEKPAVRKY